MVEYHQLKLVQDSKLSNGVTILLDHYIFKTVDKVHAFTYVRIKFIIINIAFITNINSSFVSYEVIHFAMIMALSIKKTIQDGVLVVPSRLI